MQVKKLIKLIFFRKKKTIQPLALYYTLYSNVSVIVIKKLSNQKQQPLRMRDANAFTTFAAAADSIGTLLLHRCNVYRFEAY